MTSPIQIKSEDLKRLNSIQDLIYYIKKCPPYQVMNMTVDQCVSKEQIICRLKNY
jgi:hypothetical protein